MSNNWILFFHPQSRGSSSSPPSNSRRRPTPYSTSPRSKRGSLTASSRPSPIPTCLTRKPSRPLPERRTTQPRRCFKSSGPPRTRRCSLPHNTTVLRAKRLWTLSFGTALVVTSLLLFRGGGRLKWTWLGPGLGKTTTTWSTYVRLFLEGVVKGTHTQQVNAPW